LRKWFGLLAVIAMLLVGCSGGGHTTAPVPPSDTPTVSVTVSPPTILQGESATLTWTTTNADRVEISGIPGATSPSGVVTVTPDQTTTYTVTAYGVKSMAVEVQVTVITLIVPPPPPPPPPPIFPVFIRATWVMPTTYTDGTPIPSTVVLSVLLFMKPTNAPFDNTVDIPIAEALPGAASVDFGPVDVNRGATYYFSCKAKTSTGEISDFAPSVTHIWN